MFPLKVTGEDAIIWVLLLAAWLGAWLFWQRLKKNPPGGKSN
jgi:hypothetical protein